MLVHIHTCYCKIRLKDNILLPAPRFHSDWTAYSVKHLKKKIEVPIALDTEKIIVLLDDFSRGIGVGSEDMYRPDSGHD